MWSIILWTVFCFASYLCAPPTYLSPPHFNLAEEKNITATATCGEGVPEPEMFCKLVGAIWYDSSHAESQVVDGQACDYCFDKEPRLNHKIEYAIDGTERYWQSPPLSRGQIYESINITIDLGQCRAMCILKLTLIDSHITIVLKFNYVDSDRKEFHVAYVFLKMGNAPRPDVWILERSKDGGKTYTPWQYFASTKEECSKRFGRQTIFPISKDDSVICETKFSKLVPLEGGEIDVSLINDRPNSNNFSLSEVLQEWTRATNIRLRLLKPKTTLGVKSAAFKQDPTVTRRYFYSIKEINVGGRCVCNGHASTCDVIPNESPRTLYCQCDHNTCGPQCGECCPGFVAKKWKPATVNNPNECEECNCFGHSSNCVYNETVDQLGLSLDKYGQRSGGGVCLDCQHNTEGINCDKCKPKFYRPANRPLTAINVCEPCNCNETISTGLCQDGHGRCECKKQFLAPNCDRCSPGYYNYPNCFECDCFVNGTLDGSCEIRGGQCPCKPGYTGKFCRQCAENYFGFPDCKPCECARGSSVNDKCEVNSGNCTCRHSYGGRRCEKCDVGFFNYPTCSLCDCDRQGSTEEICNPSTGKCSCKPGFGGTRCDQCAAGFFGYPNCTACECNTHGSPLIACHFATGRCSCLRQFGGKKCDKCAPGFHKFPKCESCMCDVSGSKGITCNENGQCNCKDNFDGDRCNKCKENFYNYPLCEQCNCNPAGTLPTFAGCGSLTTGELCLCKSRVTGRQCHLCKELYWNLKKSNRDGCQKCDCNVTGTISALELCNGEDGQCLCKKNVKSRTCSECVDGTYGLSEGNLFGCRECGCNLGGAINNNCNKYTGNCACRPRLQGQKCDKVAKNHYFPTLYQHTFELENGTTPNETPARFNYKEEDFPNFSWKGYANFSNIQREVILNIPIEKERLFLPVYRYVNPNQKPATAKLTLTPDFDDEPQEVSFSFEPSKEPKHIVLTDKTGVGIPPLVLSPGNWKASLKVEDDILVDYMVLIPQNYYEAAILRDSAQKACNMYGKAHLCKQYAYPMLPKTSVSMKADSANYAAENSELLPSHKYDDFDASKLGLNSDQKLAKMNKDQQNLKMKSQINANEKYSAVIIYSNPEQTEEEFEKAAVLEVQATASDTEPQIGKSVLTKCHYSFPCRQAIKTAEGAVAVFTFNSSDVEFNLRFDEHKHRRSDGNDSMPEVGVIEVALIPSSEWSMDYVTPSFVCSMKNSKCIESPFIANPEAAKFEVEKSLRVEENTESSYREVEGEGISKPILIYAKEGSIITIEGSLPKSGVYTFVVQYYQTDSPSFDIEVTAQNTPAIIPIKHCPNKMGCRSVLREKETGSTNFQISQDFSLILKNPKNRTVGLDYILVVPSDLYSNDILQLQAAESATDFLKQCAQNSFYVSTNASEFCKESVFALTTEYNNGALPCKCNGDGSYKFECEEFGGQCPCKPNIIGRTCNSCKIGYYGFPKCKPCDCPSSAICHERTGQCICPPRVTGQKCDQCRENTYGFHSILGCQECNCNLRGSENKQCDLVTGNCTCRNNIIGRTCNTCKRGYASFPHCTLCDCDIRGTTEEICNKESRLCYCKKNVYGDTCDECQPGSFFLQESNPVGCTKCFCFTTTDKCRSSSLSVIPIKDMTNNKWELVKLQFDPSTVKEMTLEDSIKLKLVENQVRAILSESTRGDNPTDNPTLNATGLYFSAPSTYLGNKITSYGLNVAYTIQNIVESTEFDDALITADLILVGNNITVVHESVEQPGDPQIPFPFSYALTEKNFKRLDDVKLTREQLMMLLVNLQHIYIKASYFKPSVEIHLMDFTLESTTEEYIRGSQLALSVEKCACPRNYNGTSCEQCARGYYRVKSGPYLGSCVPCQCHRHSDECDVETGKCFNCKNNTVGDHCEKCASGYHGDATKGSPGDCLICACPLPTEKNNFATSCEIRDIRIGNTMAQQISCTCKEGYFGPTCNVCAAGYYGRPMVANEVCKRCECNGNINSSQIGSCDSETGRCLKCLNNTSGPACEICRSWNWGDAIEKKDCRSCNCNKTGSEKCDHKTGECKCLPQVIGETCDQCEPNHWDFFSRKGCRPCECGEAAINSSCDILTGHCYCQPGVAGPHCKHCKSGFWKYTAQGCESCNCAEKFSEGTGCDQETGKCKCLPGVIGEKCNSCPPRWVFIKNVRCQKCDSCVHFLLDDTDQLPALIDPTLAELRLASASLYAYRKLDHVKETIGIYKYNITNLVQNPTPFDLGSLDKEFQSIESIGEKMQSFAELNLRKGEKTTQMAINMTNECKKIEEEIDAAYGKLNDVISELKKLETGIIHPSIATDLDRKILDSERILQFLNETSFSRNRDRSELEKNLTAELLLRIEEYKKPTIITANNISDVNSRLDRMQNASNILDKKIEHSVNNTISAETINGMTRTKLLDLTRIVKESTETEVNATKALSDASDLYAKAKTISIQNRFIDLDNKEDEVKPKLDSLKEATSELQKLNEELKPLVKNASKHAEDLQNRKKALEEAVESYRDYSKRPLDAANSYNSILSEIENATKAAEDAKNSSQEAKKLSDVGEIIE
ncbi:Laminin subunit alpha-like protein [Leptotrombidium deliense]|uniref:Laminin subunit alpha-like protein n=1 Tax=Leptotrombidium deliense TaxID=299467 RepID=A0A443SVX9_9ACAR|nr:Laminin subunit alpha-like protein [Leptotrombidium deliense]